MRRPAQMDTANSVLEMLSSWGFDFVPVQQPGYNFSIPTWQLFLIIVKNHLTRFLAGGLLFFAASAAEANAVGATAGNFAVSPSGAATYSIPIFVPPGTNGMVPKLSLNYNNQSGNGLVGVGWSIGGLSVIHRCGATILLDGFKGGVSYDNNDRFCLDGERLIYISGTEYRTQHESWKRIIASDATSNPSWFKVTNKDGTVFEYGLTADSRIEAQGSTIVHAWALNKIQDSNSNYITITYVENNADGDYWPTIDSCIINVLSYGQEVCDETTGKPKGIGTSAQARDCFAQRRSAAG